LSLDQLLNAKAQRRKGAKDAKSAKEKHDMEKMKILGSGEWKSVHIDALSYFAIFPCFFATFAPLR
jgi:hypothetical protein